ncbi:flagellar basal body-associated protein FliL [Thermodesulfatator indicus DSM 15286]|uniref:Flagellar basal body-associated protein FliL n=1 Tax=Thermodesulfatator indicus (strain DSM 15286 / JCM 11887 / CIR29812) TaxID=667014 RepID=F8A9D6_THEID|nr:hypothetical protein [Thermodesulfatator indicus]AEH44077.1 flagellar basal body-associated protein FliL [Thermodesulfatator indicus DSM 15286]
MAEEQKDLENKTPEDQDDPLAELLVEDDEGEQEAPSSEKPSEEAQESKEEPKKEKPSPPEEDPLASLLDEELLEEESEETSDTKEDLPKDEDEDEDKNEVEEESTSSSGIVWLVLAILTPALIFSAGVFTFFKLYRKPIATISQEKPIKTEAPLPKKTEPEAPLVSSPIAVETRKMLLLKNFLIPYRKTTGENVFVKAKVILYFANKRDYEIAKRNELLFREHLYRLLRNVPLYVWENPRGEETIRKEFLDYLTKKKIADVVPVDAKITGYILK